MRLVKTLRMRPMDFSYERDHFLLYLRQDRCVNGRFNMHVRFVFPVLNLDYI